eukprot:scaffold129637_cov48-Phaeocystis_antarctica.AAC.1
MRVPPVAAARSSDEFAPVEQGGSSAADLMMADARSGGWHGIAPTEAAAPSAASSQTERRVPVAARLTPASTEGQQADRGAVAPAKPAAPAAVRSTEPAAPAANFEVHPWNAQQSGAVAAYGAAGPSRQPAAAMPAASSSRPKAVALTTPTRSGTGQPTPPRAATAGAAVASPARPPAAPPALPPAIEMAGEMARLRVERDEAKRQLESAQQQLALHAKSGPSGGNGYGSLFDKTVHEDAEGTEQTAPWMLELAAKGGTRRPRLRAHNAAHRGSLDGEVRATEMHPRASNLQPCASNLQPHVFATELKQMLTHIKQPGESSPSFEPSHHIGEAAAIVSEDEKIEAIRVLRGENRTLQRRLEAQKAQSQNLLRHALAENNAFREALHRGGIPLPLVPSAPSASAVEAELLAEVHVVRSTAPPGDPARAAAELLAGAAARAARGLPRTPTAEHVAAAAA